MSLLEGMTHAEAGELDVSIASLTRDVLLAAQALARIEPRPFDLATQTAIYHVKAAVEARAAALRGEDPGAERRRWMPREDFPWRRRGPTA